MKDTASIGNLLSSLNRITPYRLGIWMAADPESALSGFSDSRPEMFKIRDLARRILRKEAFQQISFGTGEGVFGVPIKSEGTVVASLIALGPNGDGNGRNIEKFLTDLAGLIQDTWSSRKETEVLTEELSQSFEDIHLYTKIALQIKALKFSGSRLRGLMQEIFDAMRVDLVFASLPNRPEYNVFIGSPDFSALIDPKSRFIDRLIGQIPRRLPTPYFIVNNSLDLPEFSALNPVPFRFLAVPMHHNQTEFGWLGMVSLNVDEIFRHSELNLLTSMADQVAVVIANADLYREMERFVINVVRSLVHAIEAKDYYTRGHSERVNRYCMQMAEGLSLSKSEKEILHWASILHDVGKIGIPETILNKPTRLDPEEYGLIKSHSQRGVDILKPIDQLAGTLEGILHHHERCDGNGYPAGLKGENIPLISRIIAVADTFDALTTDRAYRSGIGAEAALKIMKDASGTQLDPAILALFSESIGTGPDRR
ncbi:MAG: HD domain-containing protein [Desulfobacteraceae bacterium]|nr:MAG: HD domain-containing protein [Desulfobacteraceae bacterium]